MVGSVNYALLRPSNDFFGSESLRVQMKCHNECGVRMPIRKMKANIISCLFIHFALGQ